MHRRQQDDGGEDRHHQRDELDHKLLREAGLRAVEHRRHDQRKQRARERAAGDPEAEPRAPLAQDQRLQ